MKYLVTLVALLVFSVFSIPGNAETLRVPQDYPSIMWAVGVAESGDEILIECGTYSEWGVVVENKDLIIRGSSEGEDCVVIDAHQQGSHFSFVNGNCRIENISFINSANSDGAVRINGSHILEMEHCSFRNNSNRVAGGMYVDYPNASAFLEYVSFRNNQAELYGGAIYSGGQLYMTRCEVSNNTAGQFGGGICHWSLSQAHIYTSTISSNSAAEGGGVWYNGVMNIMDCSVYDNSASIGAGFAGNENSRLYAYFTDFNDPSYHCEGYETSLHCCEYPDWMCASVDDTDCAPVKEEATSWGAIKSLYR